MADEAYRYLTVERFQVMTVFESLTYKKGDLYRPHWRSKPVDPGFRYCVENIPKRKRTFRTVEDALRWVRGERVSYA